MTEFEIGSSPVLGALMPNVGAARLLGEAVYEPKPKTELYMIVDDPADYHDRALYAGAREISPLLPRDWGHNAAYSVDPHGNVIACVTTPEKTNDQQ